MKEKIMYKTIATALAVIMLSCIAPEFGLAHNGAGKGAGNQTGSQDGTGPDRDQLRDGSCLNTLGKTILLTGHKRGKRTGAQDGSGPKRDRLRDGSCLNA
jgi:hypothetical protein